ncbi:MAG: 50S ribosomal protein L25 [Candidatus Liptonbacteria bacterium]|nr:50S ribosomal protein L25 [Candidatus Liptonbacteria bacterium]
MELRAAERTAFGKSTGALRKSGVIPAELYGHGVKNLHLSVEGKAFLRVFRDAGENTLIHLSIEGTIRPVLVHDIQRDSLSGDISHVDFYEVRMDEKLKAHVPVHLSGEAPAVKEKGGFLNKALDAVEVESLPGDLPHNFEVELGGLIDLDRSIYVKDLAAPRGVKILTDPESVIVTVTPPQKEEEVPAPEVAVAEVKVESEEKKAERDAEKAKTKETEKEG